MTLAESFISSETALLLYLATCTMSKPPSRSVARWNLALRQLFIKALLIVRIHPTPILSLSSSDVALVQLKSRAFDQAIKHAIGKRFQWSEFYKGGYAKKDPRG